MKKLYFGGPILTMDRQNPRAEAVLTESGKIVALGDLTAFAKAEAERIDLRGRTLMPAFVDGHSHMIGYGVNKTQNCDLMGCTCFEEMLERIRAFIRQRDLQPGDSIGCRGYDPAIMKEGKHPTAALLDTLGQDYIIGCVHLSGHVAVYNTRAMEAAGVLNPDYICPNGGFAGRDEAGKLNGYFEETAKAPFSALFAKGTDEKSMEQAVLTAQEVYIRNGFATVQEGSGNSQSRIASLENLANQGKLKVDVVAYMAAAMNAPAHWEETLQRLGGGYRNRLKVGGVKMFLDGSPQARTAWLSQPYEGETQYCGYPVLTDETLEKRLLTAKEYGLQSLAHCNGDAASQQYIRGWEKVFGKEHSNLRPVMIHAQTVRYDQLDRMKALGMMPSFFIGHCFYWGDTHIQNLGQRGQRISPAAQALARNMVFSFHQDSPVTEPDMLHSVWCAVNRITRSGVCVGPDNRIDCYDALIAATNGGAYTYFEENTKGILKPGAVADFVVLDRDPTSVEPMQIKDIRVLRTIKEDRILFDREGV